MEVPSERSEAVGVDEEPAVLKAQLRESIVWPALEFLANG